MKIALVTGSNRGIGLELSRQLAARGDRVYAVCRNTSPELDALAAETGRVIVVPGIDVASEEAMPALLRAVDAPALDLVVSNAGILLGGDRPAAPDWAGIRKQLDVNALGALQVAIALLPRLSSGAKVVFITSLMGSIGDNRSGGLYGYRMSKAALNMAAVTLARDLAPRGIAVAVLHPGMVKTDMTRGNGQFDVDVAVQGLIARTDELTAGTSGGFWHANGKQLPW